MNKIFIVITLCVAAMILPATAQAGVITGVGIQSVSSQWTYGPDMSAINLVNGSGLTGGGHNTNLADQWETMPYQTSAWVVFDLNGTYDVGGFHIWNFNYPGGYTGRGVHTLNILTAGSDFVWSDPVSYEFNAASGADGDLGQDFTLASPWSAVRYVKFDNMAYYGWGDAAGHIGMSEVQFSTAVPEPASLTMLALGCLALISRKRK
jgi:hypothetical protein